MFAHLQTIGDSDNHQGDDCHPVDRAEENNHSAEYGSWVNVSIANSCHNKDRFPTTVYEIGMVHVTDCTVEWSFCDFEGVAEEEDSVCEDCDDEFEWVFLHDAFEDELVAETASE